MPPSLTYPLLSIPAYYIFSLTPHIYATTLLTTHNYPVNNANPKASLSPSAVQGKVPSAVFGKYQRAENAQANCMEQMPLFAVAVLASLMAERGVAGVLGGDGGVTGVHGFVGAFLAVRAAYVLAYVQIEDHSKSFIRSSLWAVGVGLSVWQVYKAAVLLG